MITFIDATVTRESQESVLFQPVLKAYLTCHSWIITAHVSLGNLEKQWRIFIKQMERTQQLLNSIQQKPLAPTHMISTLQVELTNLDSIYTSYRPLILAATQLLKKEPSFDAISASNRHTRRSLLPFLGDALSWLIGTPTTKDVSSIKKRVNQLITTQHNQQETLVHIISLLNVTRYATQVNRQHINIEMDTVERTHQDVVTLYNFTSSLYNSLSYQQIILHICSTLANLRDSLYYMRRSHHEHNVLHRYSHNWNTYTSCTTSRRSQKDAIIYWGSTTFNNVLSNFFRRYTSLLQIPMHPHFDCRWRVPITHWCTMKDHTQQLEIYEVFNLVIPHGNFSACYNINSKYSDITYDETNAVEISKDQFSTCQKANRQFCRLNTHLQPLANLPTCIAALYVASLIQSSWLVLSIILFTSKEF